MDERLNYQTPIREVRFYFRLEVKEGAICTFAYSLDGKNFKPFGKSFNALPGKWIGAKMGLFILNKKTDSRRSWMDVDWFRVNK
jgi:hypothetical protein